MKWIFCKFKDKYAKIKLFKKEKVQREVEVEIYVGISCQDYYWPYQNSQERGDGKIAEGQWDFVGKRGC